MSGSTPSDSDRRTPRASLVIPAHNESAVIGACLERILADADPGEWEIVVVCNGCSDNTAGIARSFAQVKVVETASAGKMLALNLGDAQVTAFPRLYVDADAIVDGPALRSLAEALSNPAEVRVGSPRLVVDSRSGSPLVRAYFNVWRRLRYAREAIGSGVYGTSEAARERFGAFPERGGDDQLVYRLFDTHERITTFPSFTYVAPSTYRALVRSRARMFALNAELERAVSLPPAKQVGWRAQGLGAVALRQPRLAPAIAVFVVTQVVIKILARRLSGQDSIPWNQDRTSRGAS